jgi:hypothetical protein
MPYTQVINTAEVNGLTDGYTTTGVFKRHDGRYAHITIGEGDDTMDMAFAHVHSDPRGITAFLKGRTVVVHSTTAMGYHTTNTITWE